VPPFTLNLVKFPVPLATKVPVIFNSVPLQLPKPPKAPALLNCIESTGAAGVPPPTVNISPASFIKLSVLVKPST
jgi:hypothetical protein